MGRRETPFVEVLKIALGGRQGIDSPSMEDTFFADGNVDDRELNEVQDVGSLDSRFTQSCASGASGISVASEPSGGDGDLRFKCWNFGKGHRRFKP